MNLPEAVFETRLEWADDYEGTLATGDKPPLTVRCPALFCGEESRHWSPEELFLGALESCLLMTFLYTCNRVGLSVTSYRSRARGVVRQVDNRYRFVEATIFLSIEVPETSSVRRVGRLLRSAERACLVSQSTTVKINLESEVRPASPAA